MYNLKRCSNKFEKFPAVANRSRNITDLANDRGTRYSVKKWDFRPQNVPSKCGKCCFRDPKFK